MHRNYLKYNGLIKQIFLSKLEFLELEN